MSLFCSHCDAATPSQCNCGARDLYSNYIKVINQRNDYEQQLKSQAEKIKILTECCEFYGDEINYDWLSFEDHRLVVELDDGKRARQALARVKDMK